MLEYRYLKYWTLDAGGWIQQQVYGIKHLCKLLLIASHKAIIRDLNILLILLKPIFRVYLQK
jgi:hypothetical protein